MSIMKHDAPERTAPAAPTATTGRLLAAALCIVEDLGLDGEVDVHVGTTGGQRSMHLYLRRENVLPDGRERLAAALAAAIGGELEIADYEEGKRIAHAAVFAVDGSYLALSARLDDGEAAR